MSSRTNDVATSSAIETVAETMIACGDTSVRRCSRPKRAGSCPCSPSE